MLTRIRNAAAVRHKEVKIPSSKLKVGIAKVLQDEGYIIGYDVIDDGKQGILRIELKYGPRGEQLIRNISRESKGGKRVYRGVSELPSVCDGFGISVVSTPKGVLSDRRCREENVGGEVLCSVY